MLGHLGLSSNLLRLASDLPPFLSSLRFPMSCVEGLSRFNPAITLSETLETPLGTPGVTVRLGAPDIVAETKSIDSRCLCAWSSSFFFFTSCWVLFSCSAYAHAGKDAGTARPSGNALASESFSSMPANALNLGSRFGFLSAEDVSNFVLKCMPCFLSSKNRVNLFVAARGGDPGGEGGMSKFGTAGIVRSRVESRVTVYGECGAGSVPNIGSSSGLKGIEGPSAGP